MTKSAGRDFPRQRLGQGERVLYFRVVDPERAIIQVSNYLMATSQLAQTTLRWVLGKHDLDQMLAERDKLNADIQDVLDKQTEGWGIKVSTVEIKRIDLDESMIRAIARQAEAERTRRAKIINAEGEQQAAQKLVEAPHTCAGAAGDAIALPQGAVRYRRRPLFDDRIPVPDRADASLRGGGAADVTGAVLDHAGPPRDVGVTEERMTTRSSAARASTIMFE